MARIITVTSGKGGAGKTSISVNLAIDLAAQGHKVCLFDADLGLANVNILTGLYPEETLEAVVSGRLELKDILIRDYQGIDIIPGSSGVEMMADLSHEDAESLIKSFHGMDEYDYFIFDTSAGISRQVLSFCMASADILLVITPEPTSLTDAYALLKVLSVNGYNKNVKVAVNQVRNAKLAQTAFTKLNQTAMKFLSVKLKPVGIVVADDHVNEAVAAQTPFTVLYPHSGASKCIRALSRKLIETSTDDSGEVGLEEFWKTCISIMQGSLELGKKTPGQSTHARTADRGPKHLHGKNADLPAAIGRIEGKICELLDELKGVKNLLAGIPPENAAPVEDDDSYEEIPLDFGTWLDRYNIPA